MDGGARVRDLGERLRALRLARGETLDQAAAAVGRTGSWLSRLENGQRKDEPSHTDLLGLAEHFGLAVADLAPDDGGRGPRPDDPLDVVVAMIRADADLMAQLAEAEREASPEVFEEGLRALAGAWQANMRMQIAMLLLGLGQRPKGGGRRS